MSKSRKSSGTRRKYSVSPEKSMHTQRYSSECRRSTILPSILAFKWLMLVLAESPEIISLYTHCHAGILIAQDPCC